MTSWPGLTMRLFEDSVLLVEVEVDEDAGAGKAETDPVTGGEGRDLVEVGVDVQLQGEEGFSAERGGAGGGGPGTGVDGFDKGEPVDASHGRDHCVQ